MLSRASCHTRSRVFGLERLHLSSTTAQSPSRLSLNGSFEARRAYLRGCSVGEYTGRRPKGVRGTGIRGLAGSRNNSGSGARSNTPSLSYEGLVDLEGKPVYPVTSHTRVSVPGPTNSHDETLTSKESSSSQSSSKAAPDAPKHDAVLRISKEVARAIGQGEPVVALETTIYTHGFPYPQNLELARNLEDIVRKNGAVPATIGIVDGVAVVGLDVREMKYLCSQYGKSGVMKVSRRDLPYIMGMVHITQFILHGQLLILLRDLQAVRYQAGQQYREPCS